MKQFAKSLVSVVIALSILATMCIVGISVSAEATSGEFVVVSGTATKNVSDMSKTIASGTATMEVVNSSTLGTAPSGVPATAYKTTVDTAWDGIQIKTPSSDSSALTGNGSNALIVDAWIYVSDVSKMNNPILRIYSGAASADTGKTGSPLIGGSIAQANMKDARYGFALQTGWNHLVTTMNKFNNGGGQATLPATITAITLHDHAAPSGAYTIAVASMKFYWDSNLGKAPADGRDYLVSCVPFEGGASGTLVDATYDGGTAAYQNTSGVVVINKTFAEKDLTGKYVTAWIYVEDVTKLASSNQFELRNGTNDTNEINFSFTSLGLKNGWNKVTLDPNGGEAYGTVKFGGKAGTLQTSYAINSMRAFADVAAGVKIGTVYVTPANEMPIKPVTIDESEVADFAADEADGAYIPTQGTQSTVTLVDVSTLTGGKYEGDNTKAYKVTYNTGAARKAGAYTSLENPVRMNSDGAEADYTFEAWIWSEKDVSSYILQIYNNGYESNKTLIKTGAASSNNNTTENWIYRFGADVSNTPSNPGPASRDIVLKAGWNHIKFTLDDIYDKTNNNDGLVQLGSGSNDHTKKAYSEFVTGKTVTGFSIHDNETPVTTIAIADVKLYKTSAVKEPEKDANSVGTTIVSANLTKTEDGFEPTATGTDAKIVKTADLKGGTAGVPSADAYKVTVSGAKGGLVMKVENTDWTVPAKANMVNYGVNMWVWVSDVTKVNTFVMRFYEPGLRTGIDNWTFQGGTNHDKTAKLQTGWNNITIWFAGASNVDYDRRPNGNGPDAQKNSLLGDGSEIVEFVLEDHATTNTYDIALACARLITRTDNANGSWTAGSATGDAVNVAMVVVAILLAAMAASVTVYFGKKAR